MEQKEFPNFKEERKEKEENRIWMMLCSFFMAIFAVLIFAVLCRTIFYVIYKYYPVRGTSMQPTINPDITSTVVQDGVFAQYNSSIDYDDIIIIQLPNATNTIIKRVIAKEGDKVCIRRYPEYNNEYRVSVIRNGTNTIEVLEEDYINGYTDWSRNESYNVDYGDYTVDYENAFYRTYLQGGEEDIHVSLVKEDDGCQYLYYQVMAHHIFYLGDNRAVSKDARANGTISESGVVGVVKIIVRNVVDADTGIALWWEKFKAVITYFFDEIGNFFAWSY